MIFLTVGSQKQSFDRLLCQVDQLIEEGLIRDPVFGQIGHSRYSPRCYSFARFVNRDVMDDKLREADLVLTHAGTGTIVKALKAGKKVIAIPRLAKYGEHVDDHQLEIIKTFSKEGYVIPCCDLSKLAQALEEAKAFFPKTYISTKEKLIEDIRRQIDLV